MSDTARPDFVPPPSRRPVAISVVAAILILIAYLALQFSNQTTGSGYGSDVRHAAIDYAKAAAAFEQRTGRPPLLGTDDWPDELAGPVGADGEAIMRSVPQVIRDHRFEVIQSDSRSGAFVRDEARRITVTGSSSDTIVQWIPYGRTYDHDTKSYGYVGYLLRVEDRDRRFMCEAWDDPVKVKCDTPTSWIRDLLKLS